MKLITYLMYPICALFLLSCTGELNDNTFSNNQARALSPEQDTQSAQALPTIKEPLNDSGQRNTQCAGNGLFYLIACNATVAATLSKFQDGQFGRDQQFPSNTDGPVGMSFEKLSNTGAVLPASATNWQCVRDTVTGYVWENKDHNGNGHLRDAQKSYTNLNNWGVMDASTYVAQVNASGLCGISNWRLPTIHELVSIVDFGVLKMFNSPSGIPAQFFSNSAAPPFPQGAGYWSSTNSQFCTSCAMAYYFGGNNPPRASGVMRNTYFKIRLISYTPPAAYTRYIPSPNGTEVIDQKTGLTWRRCLEGETWSPISNQCTGTPSLYTVFQAYTQANSQISIGKNWRLPNIKEYFSIVDHSTSLPAFNHSVFPMNGTFFPFQSNYSIILFSNTMLDDATYPGLTPFSLEINYGGIEFFNLTSTYNTPNVVRLVRNSN